jgi:hypothetical protein
MANKQIKDFLAVTTPASGDLLLTQQGDDVNRKLTVAQAVGAATPKVHASSHISGGLDAFTSSQLIEAIVKRLQEPGGPTNLTLSAWADLELLGRSGTSAVGVAKATQAEAEVGTDNAKWMTALRVAQAINTLSSVRSGITGLEISNNGVDPTNDIDVAIGEAWSDDAVLANRVRLSLTTAITAGQLDATWAAGSSQGKRVSGQSLADGTWHIFLFRRSAGAIDWCFSNTFSFTLPDGGDKRKWIGAIFRTGGVIKTFVQRDDQFQWNVPVVDVSAVAVPASAATPVLTVPANVRVLAHLTIKLECSATDLNTADLLITSPDQDDTAVTAGISDLRIIDNQDDAGNRFAINEATHKWVRTDTSRQVRSRGGNVSGVNTYTILTHGWSVNRAEVR